MYSGTFGPEEEYRKIGHFYADVDRILRLPDDELTSIRSGVSGWAVAQHIYHVSKANTIVWKSMGRILAKRSPAAPEGEPNRIGRLVFEYGEMKRGVGKAPGEFQPPAELDLDGVRRWAKKSAGGFLAFSDIAPSFPEDTYRIRHFLLGMLNAREWLSFVRIHSLHHLVIINDILGAD